MRAVVYDRFGQTPTVRDVADPTPPPHGVVVEVAATGVCRSDWHGWHGGDPDIALPHVPGHELAGTIAAVGADVRRWRVGDRVTVPFVSGCGSCAPCRAGQPQVCDHQSQPGFTHWGSFAELVALDHADLNLVALPDDVDAATAASLGCRFVTSFRGVVDQGRVRAGESLVVHGCGGLGLAAVMIGRAMGARVIGVDVDPDALALATSVGADDVVDAARVDDVPAAVMELTGGGAHASIDALGITETCVNSVLSLRKQGRHVQLGWMLGEHRTPPLPMDRVMGWELELLGSHGMAAHRYGDLLTMIAAGRLDPSQLITRRIGLDEAGEALATLDTSPAGVTMVTSFDGRGT